MHKKPHHIIFEGTELTGKSFLIYNVWNTIEKENSSELPFLDGCTWFNADVGLFGTNDGWPLINGYIEIMKTLSHRNMIFEKFHLTQHIYSQESDMSTFEKNDVLLAELGFKLIITTVQPDPTLFEKRLYERSLSNNTYERIKKPPKDYVEDLEKYKHLAEKSQLPILTVDMTKIPNDKYLEVLEWIRK